MRAAVVLKQRGFDKELVVKAQAGDEQARAQVLAGLEPIFRAFFASRLGSRSEVDDLVQNTLLRVLNGFPDLRAPDRLKGFAMKAALFELQDFYRGRYRAKERPVDLEHVPEPSTGARALGPAIDLERAMASLTPHARRIIELREYGYRYEEIAEMIGSTEAAIKMQVMRAFKKLREALAMLLLLVLRGLS